MFMRRREFISAVSGAAVWSLAARAQQPVVPAIGYLNAGTSAAGAQFLAEFRKGLAEAGFVEGRNVAIEFRWADGDFNRLPQMAADLVRRRVSVIVTPGSVLAARAAKEATSTIPVVFSNASDPVQSGL